MSDPPATRERAEQQAAAWYARLNSREVAQSDLEDFRLWRQSPGNRSAYAAVEDQWRRMGGLEGDPQVRGALLQALSRPASGRPWFATRAFGFGAAGLAGLIAVVAIGYVAFVQGVVATGVGEQRSVQLADGSRVRLDTSTRIAVHFDGRSRRVELARGQAFFDVAHDASRPFFVVAGPTTVRAVGTRFDVRRDGDQVRATLVEGVVQVSGGRAVRSTWTLKPGQQIVTNAHSSAPRSVDVTTATSWTTGHIVFEGVPLGAAIDEINRYSRRRVTLDDPALQGVAVSGVFDSGDTDAFVSAVCALHDLKPQPESGDGIRLVRKGQGSPQG